MLNLDQVRLLENRVEKAIGKIQSLDAENTLLKSQLSTLQAHVSELEGLVQGFKDDQGRIEEGILNALDRLSAFEDSMFLGDAQPPAPSHDKGRKTDAAETSIPDAGRVDTSPDMEPDFPDAPQERPTAPPPADGQMDIF